LKLKYDKPLSFFAFKFNLRRYAVGGSALIAESIAQVIEAAGRGLHSLTLKLNLSVFMG
jgi:hypothetical protein